MNALAKDIFFGMARANPSLNNEFVAELAYVRSASASRRIAPFFRNAATWELALLLAIAQGGDEASVYNSVEAVMSKALGKSALLKFIHEQSQAGNLHLEESAVKRSKRIIRLDRAVEEEMTDLLDRRKELLMDLSRTPSATVN